MTTSAQDSISDQHPSSAQDPNPAQATLTAQATIYDTVVGLIAKAEPLKKKKKTIFSVFSSSDLSDVRILPTTKLSDIRMDSLEKLSVAMDLEEIYDLYIPDEDIEAFTFVSDIPAYLEDEIANKKALAEAAPEADHDEAGLDDPDDSEAGTDGAEASGTEVNGAESTGPEPKDKKVNTAQV